MRHDICPIHHCYLCPFPFFLHTTQTDVAAVTFLRPLYVDCHAHCNRYGIPIIDRYALSFTLEDGHISAAQSIGGVIDCLHSCRYGCTASCIPCINMLPPLLDTHTHTHMCLTTDTTAAAPITNRPGLGEMDMWGIYSALKAAGMSYGYNSNGSVVRNAHITGAPPLGRDCVPLPALLPKPWGPQPPSPMGAMGLQDDAWGYVFGPGMP